MRDQLVNSFGEGYTFNLLDPILEKFYGLKSKDLKIDSHRLFALHRIITSNTETLKGLSCQTRFMMTFWPIRVILKEYQYLNLFIQRKVE